MSISPNLPDSQESYHYENAGTPRWITVLFIVLFVALAGLAIAGFTTESKLQQDLTKAQEQNKVFSVQLDQANGRLAEIKSHVEITEQKLGMTQTEVSKAKSRAEEIRKDQQASDQRLTAQLTQVKQEGEEKIGVVATEVGGAKKDIEATRNDLEVTKGKLERVLGDQGVMSGLIARNRDDLEELKRRGDRNYYEFKINKSRTAAKVGPVQLTLQKVDAKKGRYTLSVFVDDSNIEKKDRTVGEPVQFYVKGTRAFPYEIVVFQLGKDDASGYLSTPKDAAASSATAKPAS